MKSLDNLHQWIITFEGSCDCTGKTSLINKFNQATNFKHLLRDRGTLSTRAYAKKFGRDIGDFDDIEKYIADYPYHLLVYMTANKEDVVKRQEEKNDGWNSDDYDLDTSLFDEMLHDSYYHNVVFLNSSEMTYEQEIEKILKKIHETEKRYDDIRKSTENLKMKDIDGRQVDFGDIIKWKNFLWKVNKGHDGNPELKLHSFTLGHSIRIEDDYRAISASKLVRKGKL